MDEKLIEQIIKEVLLKLESSNAKILAKRKKLLYIDRESMCNDTINIYKSEYVIDQLEENSNLDDYEGIILPSLSCTQISSIWNGMPVDDITKWSIDVILKGKKILITQDSVELNQKHIYKNSGLYGRISNYFEELKNDGIIVKADEYSREDIQGYIFKEKLLDERSVKLINYENIREIIVGKRTIITPLAKDLIRNLNIKIIQE